MFSLSVDAITNSKTYLISLPFSLNIEWAVCGLKELYLLLNLFDVLVVHPQLPVHQPLLLHQQFYLLFQLRSHLRSTREVHWWYPIAHQLNDLWIYYWWYPIAHQLNDLWIYYWWYPIAHQLNDLWIYYLLKNVFFCYLLKNFKLSETIYGGIWQKNAIWRWIRVASLLKIVFNRTREVSKQELQK